MDSLYLSQLVTNFNFLSISGCKPFTVALYHGTSKPSNLDEFLEDFLNEYLQLTTDNFHFENIVYIVKIKAFVCDAPARQFLKCIKAHNGYHGCERCDTEGVYISNQMTFHEQGAPRTDAAFQNYDYVGMHQNELSCLVNHGFDCIRQFLTALPSFIHFICIVNSFIIPNHFIFKTFLLLKVIQVHQLHQRMNLIKNHVQMKREPLQRFQWNLQVCFF